MLTPCGLAGAGGRSCGALEGCGASTCRPARQPAGGWWQRRRRPEGRDRPRGGQDGFQSTGRLGNPSWRWGGAAVTLRLWSDVVSTMKKLVSSPHHHRRLAAAAFQNGGGPGGLDQQQQRQRQSDMCEGGGINRLSVHRALAPAHIPRHNMLTHTHAQDAPPPRPPPPA